MEKQYYSVKEVSALLGLSTKTIQRYIHAGKIKAVKLGKEYRINKQDFNDIMHTEENQELDSLAVEVTRIAKEASDIIANPNSTEEDNETLAELLKILEQKKKELRERKEEIKG